MRGMRGAPDMGLAGLSDPRRRWTEKPVSGHPPFNIDDNTLVIVSTHTPNAVTAQPRGTESISRA